MTDVTGRDFAPYRAVFDYAAVPRRLTGLLQCFLGVSTVQRIRKSIASVEKAIIMTRDEKRKIVSENANIDYVTAIDFSIKHEVPVMVKWMQRGGTSLAPGIKNPPSVQPPKIPSKWVEFP